MTADGKRFKVRSRQSDGARREQLWSRIVHIDPVLAGFDVIVVATSFIVFEYLLEE